MRHQYNLGFISDECIFEHVKKTVLMYRTKINLKDFNKNIIDPIKLTFDSKVYKMAIEQTIKNECFRQIDKSNNNNIGYFHQNLFRYAGNGWETLPNGETGFDIENVQQHIYVEMKNKHNTMNSSSSQKTYMRMQDKILSDDQAVCMLVEVIAKKSQNEKWKISIDRRQLEHKNIRRVSIDKFYGIVFNDDKAFFKLCSALPTILDDVIADIANYGSDNTVLEELSRKSPNTMRSIYLLAFNTYDGFEQF